MKFNFKKSPALAFLKCEKKFSIFIVQIEMKVRYSENNLYILLITHTN